MHINIHINPLRNAARKWGEYVYARSLAQELTQKGVSSDILCRDDPAPKRQNKSVSLHITGPHIPDVFDCSAQMLWIISVPNLLTMSRLAQFDHVFVASGPFLHALEGTEIRASLLPQATDVHHFCPSRLPTNEPDIPLCFVGNSTKLREARALILDVINAGFDVHIWGKGWGGLIPDRCWMGDFLEHDRVAEIYARSRVVLNSVINRMPQFGFMSNRSFDALASGACVFSDSVNGFGDDFGGDLVQVNSKIPIAEQLMPLLSPKRHSPDQRQRRHALVREKYGFDFVADQIIAHAESILRTPRKKSIPRDWFRPPDPTGNLTVDAMAIAAVQILNGLSPNNTPDFLSAESDSPILHALTYDRKRLRQGDGITPTEKLRIAQKARRVLEFIHDRRGQLSPFDTYFGQAESVLARFIHDAPQFSASSTGFDRDRLKTHIALWPRGNRATLERPIGVFIHLFYDELASVFAEKLQSIEHDYRLYISTDTEEKSIRLRATFPEADIRVFDNRGRDIFPKFFGFGDVYGHHDLVLHLHGKQSIHSERLDEWLAHNLSCLMPESGQIDRIVSLFKDIGKLGVIAPTPFSPIIPAMHWAFNRDIAAELGDRMGIGELPDDEKLSFPAGSMFWARVDALQPLLKLALKQENFSPEYGQVNATTAHAIERLVGVVCQAKGYEILNVVEKGSSVFQRFRVPCKTNGDVRDYLDHRHPISPAPSPLE